MDIAIICSPGLENIELIDDTIMKWMSDNDIWLVGVVCGKPTSAGAKWASRRGAPIKYSGVWEADFIFAFDTGVDYSVKNFVSQMKNRGKHGRYIQVS
jgi:hypothetical protein